MNGYKDHGATEPEAGLVIAAYLTAANTTDADSIAYLVADQSPGAAIVADSAYASGAALETFDDLGHTEVVKPMVRTLTVINRRDDPPPYVRDLLEVLPGTPPAKCLVGGCCSARPDGPVRGQRPPSRGDVLPSSEVTSSRDPYRSAWWGVVAKTPHCC